MDVGGAGYTGVGGGVNCPSICSRCGKSYKIALSGSIIPFLKSDEPLLTLDLFDRDEQIEGICKGDFLQLFVQYIRVSTASQGKSRLGLEAQKNYISHYFKNYQGDYESLQSFRIIDIGKNSDCPGMNKAIKLAKANDAMLIVAKLDRLSRSMASFANLIGDKKLKFRVATMPEADEFELHIYAALAQQERKLISERTKAAVQQAKARGIKLGGARPQQQARHDAVKAEANQNALRVSKIIGVNLEGGKTYKYIATT